MEFFMKKTQLLVCIVALFALAIADPLAAQTYKVGDRGPGGGIIFYYNAQGFNVEGIGICHYLEAAPDSMPTTLAWASANKTTTRLTGTFGTAIGTGRANTDLILRSNNDPSAPAALACRNYSSGGKTDWFLPSFDELAEMINQRTVIGLPTGTSSSGLMFWSSSQHATNNNAAYSRDNSSARGVPEKRISYNVRAIRAFGESGTPAPAPVTINSGTYRIGDRGPGGGIVFYYSTQGFNVEGIGICHYLEAAPDSMPTTLAWASASKTTTRLTGTFGTAIGTGKSNTDLILRSNNDPAAPAALACRNYSSGGKTDWFLPSLDELGEMINQRTVIGLPSSTSSSGLMFWSSSQHATNNNAAYSRDNSSARGVPEKRISYNVRAIRAF
jgi:hypothetical protein